MISTKMGYGKAVITPKIGTPMGGYDAVNRNAEKVHDDLFLRTIILSTGSECVCIIQTDLLDVDEEFAEGIRDSLSGFDLKKENILIGAIHTHSGPMGTNKKSIFGEAFNFVLGGFDENIFNQCKYAAQNAVKEAFNNMCQCEIKYGFTKTKDICTNRNNSEKPGDNILFAMEFLRSDNKKVLLYNFACHPTVMNAANKLISADLPSGVSNEWENSKYELVMFINGSCGDISTRFTKTKSDFSEIHRLSSIVRKYILEALENANSLCVEECFLEAITKRMTVKKLDNVLSASKKVEMFKAELEEAKLQNKEDIRIYESHLEGAKLNYFLAKGLGGLDFVDININILKFGSLIFVFIPGELFSDLSNPIRFEFGARVIFCGYFNNYVGYIADKASYHAETYESLSSPFKIGEGEELIKTIKQYVVKI